MSHIVFYDDMDRIERNWKNNFVLVFILLKIMVFHKNFIPSLEDDDLILSKLSDYNNQLSHIFKSKKGDCSVWNHF